MRPPCCRYASCGREGSGRQELPVVNASGKPVLCESADYSALGIEVPASADEDWSAANPVNLDGDTSYPMVFLEFAYMPADLSPFGMLLLCMWIRDCLAAGLFAVAARKGVVHVCCTALRLSEEPRGS